MSKSCTTPRLKFVMKSFTWAVVVIGTVLSIPAECLTQKDVVLTSNMEDVQVDDDDSVRFVVSPMQDSFPTEDEASILSTSILPIPDGDDEVVFGSPETPRSEENANASSSNASDADAAAKAKNKTLTVECLIRELPEGEVPSVMVTNNSVLQKVLTPNATNATEGECIVVLFYSSQCVFSARMAPHYNALARVFPEIEFYALDTMAYSSVHVRYGIVSVPNVLLFHHGKPVARCNDTHLHLDNLAAFISKYTNLKFNGTLNVTSADMSGPVPAVLVKRIDYVLILAWVFTVFCMCLYFLKSSLCHRIVECIRNTWIEAEAQHEHTD